MPVGGATEPLVSVVWRDLTPGGTYGRASLPCILEGEFSQCDLLYVTMMLKYECDLDLMVCYLDLV